MFPLLLQLIVAALVALPAGGQTAVVSEKDRRTAAQQKINSQLLYEIYRRRGTAEANGVPPGPTDVRIDSHGRALVDVRAVVTSALQKRIRDLGGEVVSMSARDQSVVARVPILKLETLAADSTVRFVEPAAEPITNKPK